MEQVQKRDHQTIDQYIADCPPDIQPTLQRLREVIRESAPDATEAISYRMPCFRFHGILVWFAAFKDHIGFFPTPTAIEAFRGELSSYKLSKGTIQFPLDGPLPWGLIARIVEFKVAENAKKVKTQSRK